MVLVLVVVWVGWVCGEGGGVRGGGAWGRGARQGGEGICAAY